MSKLSKLRNSPERFFADARLPVLRLMGRWLAPPIAKSDIAMALLEDPVEALSRLDLPVLGPFVRTVSSASARNRRARLAAAGHPLVSVIMAARNAEGTVIPAIESLLAQTYTNLEVIVVDDASTDATPDLVGGLASRTKRVRLLRNPSPKGAALARNVGLAAASGEFLTFQDADDRSTPERIELQLAKLVGGRTLVCVVNSCRETAGGQRVIVNGRRFTKNVISMMFPRTPVFDRLGYFLDLKVGEDSEYYERIKTVFGAERESHIFKTLYRARFATGSLLFSSGQTEVGDDLEVTFSHEPANEARLDAALAELREPNEGVLLVRVNADGLRELPPSPSDN